MSKGFKRIIAVLALMLPVSVWAGVTTITLSSDAGDYIGASNSYAYSNADALITMNATGGRLTLRIDGDERWTGDFQLPDTYTELMPGTYGNLTRYPFHDPAVGGLSWYGEGRGCNTLSGWIIIDRVTYVLGELTEIEMRFEQHCEGVVAALHGDVKYYADDTTTPPGPVTPIPGGLWNPDPVLLPTEGNFVYLKSDLGDWVGGGSTYSYNEPADTITIISLDNRVTVSVGGWNADFKGMNTITELEPGYYGDLQRYPFHNPTKGGLSVGGNGRGCNSLLGWFAVDSATYESGELTAIDLRFKQHCEGGDPALSGIIHWVADTPPPAPPVLTGEVTAQGAWITTTLNWSIETSGVDVFYNGELLLTTTNLTTATFRNRKQFNQAYSVCNVGTDNCSEFVANIWK